MRTFAHFLAFVLLFGLAGCSPRGDESNIKTVSADAFSDPLTPEDPAATAAEDEEKPVRGRLTMPPGGGVWPWPVNAAPGVAAQAVTLTSIVTSDMNVRGAAVNPAAGRAVVMLWETNFKKKTSGTRVLLCDTHAGRVIGQWDCRDQYLAVFDISADGRQFLVRANDGMQRDRHILELWTVRPDGQLTRRNWQPYFAGHAANGDKRVNENPKWRHAEGEVRWAGFAGAYIVTICSCGELKVWERDGLKQIGVFPNVSGLGAVTPDGTKVAFVTGNAIALLDPEEPKILGARRLAQPPENPILAFHSNGKRLAIAGSGRVAVLEMPSGQLWDAMVSELKMDYHGLVPDFGWAGEYLYHHGDLYDLDTPIPVWHYHGPPPWSSPRGGYVWAVAQALGEKEIALRAFALPHDHARGTIRQALQQPGLFELRPGDAVRVDVSGLPAAKQKEIRAALEKRARDRGYRLDPNTTVVLEASADRTGPTRSETYYSGKHSVTGTYIERYARLKITKAGRVIWQQIACDHPPMLMLFPSGVDKKEYISRYGGPDYCLFTERPLPGVIRTESSKSTFGRSTLSATGIRDR